MESIAPRDGASVAAVMRTPFCRNSAHPHPTRDAYVLCVPSTVLEAKRDHKDMVTTTTDEEM